MYFEYSESPELPALAWCGRVERNRDRVLVLHGTGVERSPQGFVEGAWDDAFTSFNLADASIVCGTGGWVNDGRVHFTASTDRACPLFSIVKRNAVFISQSPAFVMSMAGEEPDDAYPFYVHDFLRITRLGLYCQSGRVRLRSGNSLRVHFSTIMTVDTRLSTTFSSHRLCDAPRDFETYKALLVKGVTRVLANAADGARGIRYRPLAGLSRGYDSSATAALASMAGCTDAMSFRDSRADDPQEDSGAENARYLGLTGTEYDRWAYLERDLDAEFAYFTISNYAPMAAVEPQLEKRMLVTGAWGIWNPDVSRASNQLSTSYHRVTPSIGQLEFRLRVGYQVFVAASIAARHNRAIHTISQSDEMRPWSIGGKYDKPIARRIAEEAGLPRERFGRRKLHSSHTHFSAPKYFSKKALNDYRRFVAERHDAISRFVRSYWKMRVRWRYLLWSRGPEPRMVPSTPLQRRFPFLLNAKPHRVPYEFLFVFQWASAEMRSRYRAACAAWERDPGAR